MAAQTPAKKANTAAKSATVAKNKAAEDRKRDQQQQETIKEFMATGIDFSPFVLDAGDGRKWGFTPDPQPAETEALSKAMTALSEAQQAGDGVADAFETLRDLIKGRLMSEEDKSEFPLPIYGSNALMWFALHLATGRDGFPTE